MENLRYPIGKFEYPDHFTQRDVNEWIDTIANMPAEYRSIIESMNPEQLEIPYRPEGWTARQVVHHVADSHMNAYLRFKWVLTEGETTIKPYKENLWAQLPDTLYTPVEVSIQLLENLHQRWVILMKHMEPHDFEKVYIHPQYGKKYALGAVCKLYAWHGKHHLAHLEIIKSNSN